MKKRILSTILSLCMVLSLLPARVLAQELTHLSHAVVQETALHSGAVQSGRTSRAADVGQLQSDLNNPEVDTVQMDINIDVDKTLEVTREVILDLNGNVLYSTGGGSVFVIKDVGHLTVIDNNHGAQHKFTPDADGLWVWDERDGTEIVKGGIITGGNTGGDDAGWYKADGTAWNYASDKVTGDITLYAKWTPNIYTVTFDSTGGSEVITKTMDVAYGEQLGDMPVPIRTGYFFCGWYGAMVGGKCYGAATAKAQANMTRRKTAPCMRSGKSISTQLPLILQAAVKLIPLRRITARR